MIDTDLCLRWLGDWAENAEQWWYPIPGSSGLGCYGTGYNNWGVQTNQKYAAAMAVLATKGGALDGVDRSRAADRALSALRFSLASHVTGEGRCTDGTPWGRTWISGLGLERMMHGVSLLDGAGLLTDEDRARLARLLADEADWLATDYHRGSHKGVQAAKWNESGGNDPESNLWNGAILLRAIAANPDHPHRDAWARRAEQFLFNSLTTEADADDPRYIGPNFFVNYALDHHGYLNVGYMTICVSQAAMLHFDAKLFGFDAPRLIHRHQADLWRVLRRMIFTDGRLARIGGDTRVRYCYCQDYLLPSLCYAADHLGDAHAPQLIAGQLQLIDREHRYNGDGSFFGKRLATLAGRSPYYYTRLESDRACAVGMTVAYAPLVRPVDQADGVFESSVAGSWCEPTYGAALHRSPTRLASFAWRAQGLAQGLCQPPDDGHFAEWARNLAGSVDVADRPDSLHPHRSQPRRLGEHHVQTFNGGFIAHGTIIEGADVSLAEGWCGGDSVMHRIVFVALPDAHSVIGLQRAVTASHRVYIDAITGMCFNLPNDLYNDFARRLATARGERVLTSPPDREGAIGLASRWANVDGRIGLVGLYGDGELTVDRSAQRRAGPYESLFIERLAFGCHRGTMAVDPNTVVLDVGWAVISSADAAVTECFAGAGEKIDTGRNDLRAVRVTGLDGRRYTVAANFGDASHDVRSWCAGEAISGDPTNLPPGGACLVRSEIA